MARLTLALLIATAGVAVTGTVERQPTVTPSVHAASTSLPDPPLPRASRSVHRLSHPKPQKPRFAVSHVLRGWQRLLDVTAYCATGNRTASGAWPQLGMAATLGRSIPFGTRLHIAGYGDVTVTDRIGWGSDVDVYLGAGPACEQRASAWGRRRLLVTEVGG